MSDETVVDPLQSLEPPDEPRESLLHRWFVRYNPLYFFSAACVLYGTYLVHESLEDWTVGTITLAATLQLYELALIGSAALLFRVANQRRPAIVLALLSVLFFFDPSLRSETLATLHEVGPGLSLVWFGLAITKVQALAWAFRLELRWPVQAFTSVVAAALAAVPHALRDPSIEKELVIMLAAWLTAASIVVAFWLRPHPRLRVVLTPAEVMVLDKCIKAATAFVPCALAYHFCTSAHAHDVVLTLHYAVPFLPLFALVGDSGEIDVWLRSLVVVAVTQLEPTTTAATCCLLGIGLLVMAWRGRMPGVYVIAVATLYVGIWHIGLKVDPLPPPPVWLVLAGCAAMLTVAWVHRRWTGVAGAIVIATTGTRAHDVTLTGVHLGAAILLLGFAALAAGVGWDFLRKRNGQV